MKTLFTFAWITMLFCLTINSYGQSTWDGGGVDDDWNTADNWNPNGVPGNADTKIIPLGFNVIISGTVDNSSGTITNSGTITITSSGTYGIFNGAGGTITNNGIINIASSSTHGIYNNPGSNFTNNGTITITSSGENGIRNRSPFTNSNTGIITVANIGSFGLVNESSLTNNGAIYLCPPGTTGGTVPTSGNPVEACPPAIPTLSQWGLFLLMLSLLIISLVTIRNMEGRKKLAMVSAGNQYVSQNFKFPFDSKTYLSALKTALLLAPLGFLFIYTVWGMIIIDDFIGMAVAVPMVAYLIYLVKGNGESVAPPV